MKIKYKRLLVVLFFVLFTQNNVYGQENAFFFNIGSTTFRLLLIPNVGIGYERKINDFSSFLFTGDLTGYVVMVMDASYGWESAFQMDFLVHYRWYPLNTSLKRLFLDAGAGLSFHFITMEDTTVSIQFPIQIMAGWRFNGKKYFFQPWIGYNIAFGEIKNSQYASEEIREWVKYGVPCIGLAVGFLF